MEDIWLRACQNLQIPDNVAQIWFVRIRDKLSNSSGRFYHNWKELLIKKKDYLTDVNANIVLAIFFQYYEFDGKRNCVEKNCLAFEEFCTEAGFANVSKV